MSTTNNINSEKEAARHFWKGLDTNSRWELGDELVGGTLDHLAWFGKKVSTVFLNELDNERLNWEATLES